MAHVSDGSVAEFVEVMFARRATLCVGRNGFLRDGELAFRKSSLRTLGHKVFPCEPCGLGGIRSPERGSTPRRRGEFHDGLPPRPGIARER
eukprot:6791207-Lingulodinium_polyedra.AAC.1